MGLAERLADLQPCLGSAHNSGEDAVAELAREAEVLCVALGPVSKRVIDAAPRLRLVVKCGIGTDNIDLAAALSHGIRVMRTARVNYRGVPEFVMGAMIMHFRRVQEMDAAVRRGSWSEVRAAWAGRLIQLRGRLIGIVGFGAIGQETARLAAAFGMRIIVNDPHIDPVVIRAAGAEPAELATLLATADVVSVHVLLTEETRHLFGAARFATMRPDALFVNTSRGPVVDEAALAEALNRGLIAGAVLDVLEREPPAPDNPLLTLDRVLLSPHLAGCGDVGYAEIGELAAEHVRRHLAGQPPIESSLVV